MTIYRSPLPDIEIPETSVAHFVLARAADRGDRAALVDGVTGRTIAYAELPRLVDGAAGTLARGGISKGDVCAIFSPNAPEYALAVLAILRLGAVVTTASPLCTKVDLVKQLKDSKARILISPPVMARTAVKAAHEAGVRLKELIKYRGMQIPPAELEAVLLSHPAVADAGVVPLKDDEAGEVPHAYVVLRGAASGDELMAFVAQRVAPYKKVRRVSFVEAIPKSPSGKILRRVLRDGAAV
jgi:acyl-coenzyme A synthetase/AMP-(fatty) acid ligase